MNKTQPIELICPAGTLAGLETCVDAGADTVYVGFRDETNARNFPGLNFSREELAEGIDYAHAKQTKVFLAVNTFARAGNTKIWIEAIDDAARLHVDAIILADLGMLDYCTQKHPELRRHLSVQASASNEESIRFYHREFGVKRVVLPRVLTAAEIIKLSDNVPVETEIFAFGGLCIMAEGRCSLSSYATGESPNTHGVCSPASHVRYEQEDNNVLRSKLGDFTINLFREEEYAGYPVICKGRFYGKDKKPVYPFEQPASLNVLEILPSLIGHVKALKIEGRQRGRDYIRKVVTAFRKAIDAYACGETVSFEDILSTISEGQRSTTGPYEKEWL